MCRIQREARNSYIVKNISAGMVAFRLRGDNTLTERLLKRLNARGFIHAVPACFKGVYVIRFTVTSQRTTNQDVLGEDNDRFFLSNNFYEYVK